MATPTMIDKAPGELREQILATDDLVALWDFAEPAGKARVSHDGRFTLVERGETMSQSAEVERVAGGPVSGYAANLTGREFLSMPFADTGPLNVGHTTGVVSVIAWVKRTQKLGFTSARGYPETCAEFVAGIWREYDHTRSYGLYVDLPMYGGADQVIGHVSDTGGATEGYPYSRDYSASVSKVPVDEWSAIAFTYDGELARSFFNGVCEERPGFTDRQGETYSKNPYPFPAGLYDGLDPAKSGADFTVGAVTWEGRIHNRFVGLIGGVAVFDRALSEAEIASLS